uniref:Enamine deaminase RidA, house cleaning of reactive enamine intermediates, YjgF/YER057c/UK114 family n=1 Tax=Candidatus Kentrum sp. SD TaxID=2126332 RepID=A0A451BJS6_9GAMM|nr:MAG: Enamine deaminase RidA, house cleaning of reactive enamine intermediates, YjgF/YER057c/UK114 family [Candidatus Kentron sp. SD]VFK43833.1 MAG: Enamine deaminase RidA, house cleaning of reactive enamine intermediates, YjgF/YER057c/UK114 family [Candidatus Kentron sp. SD]VFK78537.1 MAG: Enamine deaminase RidA, house cleaning of reactive enamine intermediates, YjgF/YER057c/UK114 family [Candidatus Kentron sp. SD]
MSTREQKLEALGYPLSKTVKPAAMYDLLAIDGKIIYASGSIPLDGATLVSIGKVPSDVSLDEAQGAAALCVANIFRTIHAQIGKLSLIERVLRLTGFVNSAPGFTEQHLVINGASQLCIDVFGDAGRHARSAVGVHELPLNASVEVEMILKWGQGPIPF